MVPSDLRELAKSFEGFHRVVQVAPQVMAGPYLCPAGVPTIGYGCIRYPDGRAVSLADGPITIEEGERYLDHELEASVRAAVRLCPILLLEPAPRLVAIADFAFNLGPGRLSASTLRRRVNAGDWPGAAVEIRKWVWGGGKKLPGLIRRREAEAELLLS